MRIATTEKARDIQSMYDNAADEMRRGHEPVERIVNLWVDTNDSRPRRSRSAAHSRAGQFLEMPVQVCNRLRLVVPHSFACV